MGVRSLRSSITLSLALHLLLGLACFLLLSHQAAIPRKVTWIQLQPAVNPELLKKAQEALKSKNQIVQTAKAQPTQTAPKNAFLGAQNQVADRQTVSRNHTTSIGRAQQSTKSTSQARRSSAAKSKQVARAAPPLPAIKTLGVPIFQKPRVAQTDEQVAHQENWAAQGGASPEDYVKGVKESDRTLLNTKQYVFFGYYQRIRQRLDRAWIPILREKLLAYYDSGRQLASDTDHSTKVLVLLNRQGEITAVKVLSESGTEALDQAAVAAFNQAGPFPNPPKGLIGADGVIEIPWEFVLRT